MSYLVGLRSGIWVTRSRMIAVTAMMAAMAAASLGYLLATAHGTVDFLGRPLGTDFSDVWTAGWMANHGQAAQAWTWPRHYAVQRWVHRRSDIPFYGWHYPPPFLLVAALLASLPYVGALIIWQAASLTAAAAVARRILPDPRMTLFVIGFPATFVCLGHGQNGFLTAALLGLGLLLLEQRPLVAGLVLGCLVYKPQFALVLPVLLIAGRHWRAVMGATASVLLLTGLTTLLWGVTVWQAFVGSLALTRTVVLEGMNTGAWKIVSAFAAVRLNGGGADLAYGVQTIVSLMAVVSIIRTGKAEVRVRNAIVASAALLTTPYVFDYDMVVLGLAIAFLAAQAHRTGWRPWERSALAIAFMTPAFARQLTAVTGFPFGLTAILIVWAIALRRTSPAVVPAAVPVAS